MLILLDWVGFGDLVICDILGLIIGMILVEFEIGVIVYLG